MKRAILFVFILVLTLGAVEEDLVKSVPGYQNFTTNIYSGYLDTNSPDRKLHYVFVESANGKNNKDPVTLWLNGGPGCSSMLGFLQEIGPFYLEDGIPYKKDDKLVLNKYSWHTVSNLLFIESPAGVGFSYNLDKKYEYNDTTTAADALSALLFFYKQYNEYINNSLWIAGESYAGKYIPDLAVLIDKISAINHLNLKGILVGNGIMDFRDSQLQKSSVQFMINHEFIDPELINYWKTSCAFDPDSAGCNYFMSRYELDLDDLNPYNVYDYCFYNSTSLESQKSPKKSQLSILRSISQFLKTNKDATQMIMKENNHKYGSAPCIYLDGVEQYFNANRQQYHAKFPNMAFNGPCANNITYNVDLAGSMKSYQYLIGRLHKYHIFLYNGDWDQVVPYTDTLKNLKKLNLQAAHDYAPWFTNGQHSGFMQNWSGVHYIQFKGASHMVPQSKRAQALHFFKQVVEGTPENLLIR